MYKIILLRNCNKFLNRLGAQEYKKVSQKILELEQNPRPRGVAKLTESEYWRIREGDYRIIYIIDDTNKIITVTKIGHRREIYRDI